MLVTPALAVAHDHVVKLLAGSPGYDHIQPFMAEKLGFRDKYGAEMISSITGLGFLIDDARWQMRPDIMVAGMITIAMIGWVMENWAFDWLERVTVERWGMKKIGRAHV